MQPTVRCNHTKRRGERGSIIVEMAFLIPVMVLVFMTTLEFSTFIAQKERANRVANQVAGVLYGTQTQDVNSSGEFNAYILNAATMAQTLSAPYPAPQIITRICEVKPDGSVWRDDKQVISGGGANCGSAEPTEANCQGSAVVANGYGCFAQVYTCSSFKPLLTPKFLTGTQTIKTMAYIPSSKSVLCKQAAAWSNDGPPVSETGPGGVTCTAPQVLENGVCVTPCPSGQTRINGVCTPGGCQNGPTDPATGTCYTACPSGATPPACTECPAGKVMIGGTCFSSCTNGATNPEGGCTACTLPKTMVNGTCSESCPIESTCITNCAGNTTCILGCNIC